MELFVNKDGNIQLNKVYNPVVLESNNNEEMIITMRDSGFEFKYQGIWYCAKNGIVEKLNKINNTKININHIKIK